MDESYRSALQFVKAQRRRARQQLEMYLENCRVRFERGQKEVLLEVIDVCAAENSRIGPPKHFKKPTWLHGSTTSTRRGTKCSADRSQKIQKSCH